MLCSNCGHHNRQGARFCDACATRLNAPQGDVQEPDEVVTGLSADFVGRQREMAELNVALDEAIFGRGRLVMLAGEPGIGKTRTAQELADIAEERGARVLWGRCLEQHGSPHTGPGSRPYAPTFGSVKRSSCVLRWGPARPTSQRSSQT